VLVIENGHTRTLDEPPAADTTIDEFLSPIVDIIPAQLFADALARQRPAPPGFRYISKVITRL
jgi:hypothetical protein